MWRLSGFFVLALGSISLLTGCMFLRKNEPPVAVCDANVEEALTGEEILFDGSASFDPDGAIVAYDWDFGEQGAGIGAVVNHDSAPGEYTVRFTVRDNRGAVATAEKKITARGWVGPEEPILAAFTVLADVVAPFVYLTFDASPSRASDAEIVEYFWNLGIAERMKGKWLYTSTSSLGKFRATLIVQDSSSLTGTTYKLVRLIEPPADNQPPMARFTYSPKQPKVEEGWYLTRGNLRDGATAQY